MFLDYQANNLLASGAVLTSGTEVAIAQTSAINLPPASQGRCVMIRLNATGGATGGTWTFKCRLGAGIAGTQVDITKSYAMAANDVKEIMIIFLDTTNQLAAGDVYTVTATAAGSNGTYNDGAIQVYDPVPGGSDV